VIASLGQYDRSVLRGEPMSWLQLWNYKIRGMQDLIENMWEDPDAPQEWDAWVTYDGKLLGIFTPEPPW